MLFDFKLFKNFTKDYQTITIDFLHLGKSLIVSLFFSHFDLHHFINYLIILQTFLIIINMIFINFT